MISLRSPTRSGFVSSAWGAPRSYRGGWHEGLDFPDSVGAPVYAAADGVIARAVPISSGFAGRWVAIDHGAGVLTRYMHNTALLVKDGDRVRRGQQIATVGTTGTQSSAPHVHFDVRMGEPSLSEYKRRFAAPTMGYGRMDSAGKQGVPAEPLMYGVTYGSRALMHISASNVSIRKPTDWLMTAGIALSAGYLAYKVL